METCTTHKISHKKQSYAQELNLCLQNQHNKKPEQKQNVHKIVFHKKMMKITIEIKNCR